MPGIYFKIIQWGWRNKGETLVLGGAGAVDGDVKLPIIFSNVFIF